MSVQTSRTDLAGLIKSSPHWRIIVRPVVFEAERIPTLRECWSVMEACRVTYRGWDYPHVDSRDRANGTDWIASWSDFEGHREYWRLYQSAQFVHLFSFREDQFRDEAAARARASILALRDGAITPSGYVDVISTIYTLTEIFEFAARLAERKVLGGKALIRIELRGVQDRALFILDSGRAWWKLHQASEDVLAKEWTADESELLAAPADLAQRACLWFFERFQWLDPPSQMIAKDQQRLIERRF